MRPAFRLATLAIFATATFAAHADTIYSQFGPSQTFSTGSYVIGVPVLGNTANQLIASSFIPTETATLTDAVLAMRLAQGFAVTNPVTVFIESSVASAPGSIIDTLTQVGNQSGAPSLIDFVCASCSVLDAGTMYFLVAYQPDIETSNGWNFVDLTTKGTVFDNQVGSPTGPWSNDPNEFLPAFEVNGTTSTSTSSTPEPSTLVLLGTGILGLAGVARRKFCS